MEPRTEFRCEMTPDFLDQVAPQLGAAMLDRHDRVMPARRERLRPIMKVLRVGGLAVTALGIGLAGYGIAVTPDAPCNRGRLVEYHLVMVLYVVVATVFWFMPRINDGLAAWARRSIERRVPSMLAPLRRRAPYTVEYRLAGGRIETRAPKLRLVRTTELRAHRAAVVTPQLACLYRGRDSAWLRRVIYLPDAGARLALIEALRGAGAEVTELAAPAGG